MRDRDTLKQKENKNPKAQCSRTRNFRTNFQRPDVVPECKHFSGCPRVRIQVAVAVPASKRWSGLTRPLGISSEDDTLSVLE